METQAIVKASAEHAQSDKMFQWLSPSDPSVNHNKALSQRHDGTGRWFIEGERLQSFREGQTSFLWLYGIPGCGKTILSASIIEELEQESLSQSPMLLYFYFDFNDSRKQTLDNVLRSLLWQTAKCLDGSPKDLAQLYSSCRNGRDQPSTSSLVETLYVALRNLSRTRIVLDALDECTTKPDLMQWLYQLAGQTTSHLQIIVTSRKEHGIEMEFGKWLDGGSTIPFRQLDVDADISSYVDDRLRTDSQLQRWRGRPRVQVEIKMKLVRKANGM
jgi:Cdc6-like AAA superfamily ATPase